MAAWRAQRTQVPVPFAFFPAHLPPPSGSAILRWSALEIVRQQASSGAVEKADLKVGLYAHRSWAAIPADGGAPPVRGENVYSSNYIGSRCVSLLHP